jgi:hypothetical protein
MKLANAIKINRKSGRVGHPGLVVDKGFQALTSGAGEYPGFIGQ